MTEEFYLSEMAYLCQLLNTGKELQIKKGRDYWPLMKNMSEDEFHTAVVGIVREFVPSQQNPFPMPSHFLRFSSFDAQGQAVNAISLLKAYVRRVGKYQSVNFSDSALHSVVERFGGWPAICCMGDDDWNVNEGRMVELYKTLYQSGRGGAVDHCPGIAEKDAGYYKIIYINPSTSKEIGYKKYNGCTLIAQNFTEQIQQMQPLKISEQSQFIGDLLDGLEKKLSLIPQK